MSFDPWLVVNTLGCSRNLIVSPSLTMTSSCGRLFKDDVEPLMDLSEHLFQYLCSPTAFQPPSICRGNLRVARQVNILRTISDELHKATGSHVLYPAKRKKFRQLRGDFTHQILVRLLISSKKRFIEGLPSTICYMRNISHLRKLLG